MYINITTKQLYYGDKQYGDIDATSERPNDYSLPVIENGVHAGWEEDADLKIQHNENVLNNRKSAYITESDPLYFMVQRGEATEAEWLAKITEIKERFPKV